MPDLICHLTVVLPAFNEEKDLPALLSNLNAALNAQPLPWKIVVVDDGSQDRTAAVAQEAAAHLPVYLVRHPQNMGLGRAIQTGLTEARRFGGAVITMDADNSHDPRYISDMVAVLNREPVDLVIASRYRRRSRVVGVPFHRQLLSYGCYFLMKLCAPYRNVRDYSTGFRAYRAAALDRLACYYGDRMVESSGFACMLELLLKLRGLNIRAAEIPYTLRYDQKLGASKLRLWRTLKQYWHVLAKFRTNPAQSAGRRTTKNVPVRANGYLEISARVQ